jgi:hypothetical protein
MTALSVAQTALGTDKFVSRDTSGRDGFQCHNLTASGTVFDRITGFTAFKRRLTWNTKRRIGYGGQTFRRDDFTAEFATDFVRPSPAFFRGNACRHPLLVALGAIDFIGMDEK